MLGLKWKIVGKDELVIDNWWIKSYSVLLEKALVRAPTFQREIHLNPKVTFCFHQPPTVFSGPKVWGISRRRRPLCAGWQPTMLKYGYIIRHENFYSHAKYHGTMMGVVVVISIWNIDPDKGTHNLPGPNYVISCQLQIYYFIRLLI